MKLKMKGEHMNKGPELLTPLANPQAGSINRVAYALNDPATGKVTVISPRACTVQNSTLPMIRNPIRRDAGPPVANA